MKPLPNTLLQVPLRPEPQAQPKFILRAARRIENLIRETKERVNAIGTRQRIVNPFSWQSVTKKKLLELGVALCALGLFSLGMSAFSGCASAYKETLGGETEQVFTRIYLTDFDTAWQSVLESMKHNRLDISNREAGYVQTKWTDNTDEKNMADSYSGTDAYLKAQYRFRVNVAKGFYNGKPSVKVTVQKEQLVQQDVLEGWRPQATDAIEENTLLYRIGRIIFIKMKLARIEQQKTQQQIDSTKF